MNLNINIDWIDIAWLFVGMWLIVKAKMEVELEEIKLRNKTTDQLIARRKR